MSNIYTIERNDETVFQVDRVHYVRDETHWAKKSNARVIHFYKEDGWHEIDQWETVQPSEYAEILHAILSLGPITTGYRSIRGMDCNIVIRRKVEP